MLNGGPLQIGPSDGKPVKRAHDFTFRRSDRPTRQESAPRPAVVERSVCIHAACASAAAHRSLVRLASEVEADHAFEVRDVCDSTDNQAGVMSSDERDDDRPGMHRAQTFDKRPFQPINDDHVPGSRDIAQRLNGSFCVGNNAAPVLRDLQAGFNLATQLPVGYQEQYPLLLSSRHVPPSASLKQRPPHQARRRCARYRTVTPPCAFHDSVSVFAARTLPSGAASSSTVTWTGSRAAGMPR